MSWFSSMLVGSNPTLNQGIKQAGQISGYGTSEGEGLTSAAGNFFEGLLGGNPAQTAKLLAPQIQGMQQRAQQQKNVNAQFGNRSGGTNAANQTIDDTTRSNIDNMISSLTGEAASQAAGLGTSLLSTGLQALNNQVDFSQIQMQNWQNSIFGQGLSTAAGFGEGAALGKIPIPV